METINSIFQYIVQNPLQAVGFALGLLYLWLEYKANIWLWAVSVIMPIVHGYLYYSKGLYADCGMQVYYILAAVYGWTVWKFGVKKDAPAPEIQHTPLKRIPQLATVYIIVHAALYLFLSRCTDSTVPFWDSLTTALCVIAMWMLSRKYLEQWLVWLAVDAITVGLYAYKDLPITAGLYTIYTILAIAGYFRWKKEIKKVHLNS